MDCRCIRTLGVVVILRMQHVIVYAYGDTVATLGVHSHICHLARLQVRAGIMATRICR